MSGILDASCSEHGRRLRPQLLQQQVRPSPGHSLPELTLVSSTSDDRIPLNVLRETLHNQVLKAPAEILPNPMPSRISAVSSKSKILPRWHRGTRATGGLYILGRNDRTDKPVCALFADLEPPIDWHRLDLLLSGLTKLGFSMKIWSRFLCLLRPDLYCTVAAPSVRNNLSEVLTIPQNRFQPKERDARDLL